MTGSSDKLPVTLRQRRLVHQNSKWRVFADDITGADGSQVDGFIVVAPQVERDDRVGGVTIIPVMPDGRIGLVSNYRHHLELLAWEAPRGFLDPGETDLAGAALRELAEETGLSCERQNVIPLGVLAQEASLISVRGGLFVGLDCRMTGTADRSEPGLGELAFFTLDEALALADEGQIQDSATLITLYRYALGRHTKR